MFLRLLSQNKYYFENNLQIGADLYFAKSSRDQEYHVFQKHYFSSYNVCFAALPTRLKVRPFNFENWISSNFFVFF